VKYDICAQAAGRRVNKNRSIRICTVGLLAVLAVGCGSSASHGPVAGGVSLSHARLSLPGASVAMPRKWRNLSLPASEHAVAATPSLSPPCPNTLFGGPAACQDALTLASVPGSDPRHALEQAAKTRFMAMHSDIVATKIIRQGSAVFGGCPAYVTEWHVTWVQPPDTTEDLIVLRTGVTYANSDLESVFIRFADTSAAPPRAVIDAIASSIRCAT
jgi:hypothetical protein